MGTANWEFAVDLRCQLMGTISFSNSWSTCIFCNLFCIFFLLETHCFPSLWVYYFSHYWMQLQLTGIVWLPCKLVIADWASCCEPNLTKAQPEKEKFIKAFIIEVHKGIHLICIAYHYYNSSATSISSYIPKWTEIHLQTISSSGIP